MSWVDSWEEDGAEYTYWYEESPPVPDHFPDDFDYDTGAGRILSDTDYLEFYQKKLRQEYRENNEEDFEDPHAIVEVSTEIGDLTFKPEFSDPTVNVINNRNTAEHSIVTGESDRGSDENFFVQAQGRRPTEIEIVGWVTKDQLDIVDNFVTQTGVDIITDRWTGTAVPKEVRTDYNRLFHDTHGFIFEVTISFVAVSRGEFAQELGEENSD